MKNESTVHRMAVAAVRSRRFRVIAIFLFIMWLVAGVAIVPVERRYVEIGNIRNYGDGLWWSITTITGVGYGDTYPVSSGGRVIGGILEVFGVVLFGSVIAIVSISLLRYQEDYYVRRMMGRIDGLELKLVELKKHIDYLVREKTGE